MFSGASPVLTRVEKNRENWHRMNEKVNQLQLVSNSMDIFNLDIKVDEEEDGVDPKAQQSNLPDESQSNESQS